MFRFEFIRNVLTALVAVVVLTGASLAADNKPFFENDVNRWGADYSIFDIKSGGANACYHACAKDKQCLAWTFHRPGTKGKLGECHLKSKVAHGRSNPCCVSGVLVGQSGVSGERSAVTSGDLTGARLSRSYKSAAAKPAKRGFFRKAKLTRGEAFGLPELQVAAVAPPFRITPLSFTTSDEF